MNGVRLPSMKLTGRLVVSCCRDMLRRRTSLVANGARRTCKWLPRAIVVFVSGSDVHNGLRAIAIGYMGEVEAELLFEQFRRQMGHATNAWRTVAELPLADP